MSTTVSPVTTRPNGSGSRPVRVYLAHDFDVTARGVEDYLTGDAPGRSPEGGPRFEIQMRAPGAAPDEAVDVALYDPAAAPSETRWELLDALCGDPQVRCTALYSGHLPPAWVQEAMARGARCHLLKSLTGTQLRARILDLTQDTRRQGAVAARTPRWPGASCGLTLREADVISLVARGQSNEGIAEALLLSPNTVKSYIRTAYRKMGVQTRSHAVLWALEHGMRAHVPPSIS